MKTSLRSISDKLWIVGVFAAAALSTPAFAAKPSTSNTDSANNVASAGAATSDQNSDTDKGYEELTQGPVHEAFAEPVVFDPTPGLIVPDAPPDPIKELQPKEKPSGAGVIWIPGYWGWDADKKDFIWISGIWRVPPPDRKWTPGYWSKADSGYQWVSGFWEQTGKVSAEEATAKLPEPPKSLEKGPSSPAPDDDHIWIPGHWEHGDTDYAWSPGYWTPGRPDCVWIPAHYIWTPGGYDYASGYWDYPIASRGLLFAPVYFPQPIYAHVGFAFSPGLVISTDFMVDNFFCYAGYNHYCFGNFYDPGFVGIGIYPWCSPVFLNIGFCDVWEHSRWHFCHDWDHHHHDHDHDGDHHDHREDFRKAQQDKFDHRRDNATERPARTFKEAAAKQGGLKGAQGVARSLKSVVADKSFSHQFASDTRRSVASARQATLADRHQSSNGHETSNGHESANGHDQGEHKDSASSDNGRHDRNSNNDKGHKSDNDNSGNDRSDRSDKSHSNDSDQHDNDHRASNQNNNNSNQRDNNQPRFDPRNLGIQGNQGNQRSLPFSLGNRGSNNSGNNRSNNNDNRRRSDR